MPANDESDKWFVRITQPHGVIRATLDEFKKKNKNYTRLVCVLHFGTKTQVEHAHYIIQFPYPVQRQTLAARWKAIWHIKATHFANEKWDGDMTALQYLFAPKSSPVLCFSYGFSDEEVEEAKVKALEFQQRQRSHTLTQAEPAAVRRRKEATTNDVIDLIAETIRTYPDMENMALYERVITDAIELLNKHRVKFSQYSIRTIIDTAMCRAGGVPQARFKNSVLGYYLKY